MAFAIAVVRGDERLLPREPSDSAAVELAETTLSAVPRPVYAYVGDLHPDLGTIGLIFSRVWTERSLQGVTRCDSGGLAGRRGGFDCLGPEEALNALLALSTPQTCTLAEWPSAFSDELEKSYPEGVEGYVKGEEPDLSTWKDERVRCIKAMRAAGKKPDRRLWTWEVRMSESPIPEDLRAIVFSPEAFKRAMNLRLRGMVFPGTVRLIAGDANSMETRHWFHLAEVRNALRESL